MEDGKMKLEAFNKKVAIYFNKETDGYLAEPGMKCDICGAELFKSFFIKQERTRTEQLITKRCNVCIGKRGDKLAITVASIILVIVGNIASQYSRVAFQPLQLNFARGDYDTFESVDGETVIDKTKQCHNPDFMKMPEYNPNHIEDTKNRIKELDGKATDDFFNKLVTAKPFQAVIIDENKTKKKITEEKK